jgi:hypothetical protein
MDLVFQKSIDLYLSMYSQNMNKLMLLEIDTLYFLICHLSVLLTPLFM